MKSEEKARKYYNDNKVFPIQNSPLFELWVVEANTGNWNIRYDKLKELYDCTCKNVRLTDCSHIKGVKIYKEKKC